jgi:hypothetical protein
MALPGEITPAEALSVIVDDRVATSKVIYDRLVSDLIAAGRVVPAYETLHTWDVDVGGETATGADNDGTPSTTNDTSGNTVPRTLPIAAQRIKYRFSISRIKMKDAAKNGPLALRNLLGATVDRGISAIMQKLNAMLYTGTGNTASGGVIGLNAVIDNTADYASHPSVTYADINSVTMWNAINLNNGGTPRALTRLLFYNLDKAAEIRQSRYNYIITHPDVWEKYTVLFDEITGEMSAPNASAGGSGPLPVELGHTGRQYRGIEIRTDPACPNTLIHFLNMMDVELQMMELPMAEPSYGPHSISRALGLPLHITEYAPDEPTQYHFEMYILPQLKVFNRKSSLAITDLNAAL